MSVLPIVVKGTCKVVEKSNHGVLDMSVATNNVLNLTDLPGCLGAV